MTEAMKPPPAGPTPYTLRVAYAEYELRTIRAERQARQDRENAVQNELARAEALLLSLSTEFPIASQTAFGALYKAQIHASLLVTQLTTVASRVN